MIGVHGYNSSRGEYYKIACNTTKDLLIVEGAGHAESCYMAPDVYFDTVFSFIEENCL